MTKSIAGERSSKARALIGACVSLPADKTSRAGGPRWLPAKTRSINSAWEQGLGVPDGSTATASDMLLCTSIPLPFFLLRPPFFPLFNHSLSRLCSTLWLPRVAVRSSAPKERSRRLFPLVQLTELFQRSPLGVPSSGSFIDPVLLTDIQSSHLNY